MPTLHEAVPLISVQPQPPQALAHPLNDVRYTQEQYNRMLMQDNFQRELASSVQMIQVTRYHQLNQDYDPLPPLDLNPIRVPSPQPSGSESEDVSVGHPEEPHYGGAFVASRAPSGVLLPSPYMVEPYTPVGRPQDCAPFADYHTASAPEPDDDTQEDMDMSDAPYAPYPFDELLLSGLDWI